MNNQVADALRAWRRAADDARRLEQALGAAMVSGNVAAAEELSVRLRHQWTFAREMLRTTAELLYGPTDSRDDA